MRRLLFPILIISTPVVAKDIPQIQVQGNCEIKVVPDRGTITFSAENQSKDQKEAVKKTVDQINKLKTEINSLNLKHLELKNTNYSVFPIREYEKDRYIDKGTRASLSLEVTTSEIEKIGETIMKASKVGIMNVGALVTFLSLEKSRQEYLKCLDIAADDARAKANQLGKKLGFKVGEVIHLNEVPTMPQHEPRPEHKMIKSLGTMAAAAAPQIEAGTEQYATNIQVTFSIK